jgi:non-specific serine/threonine protein kinase/serine/threonine-protein kinase
MSLPADRWDEAKRVFHAALDRPPAERAAFVASACGADAALGQEVQSLLDWHERSGDLIEPPPLPPETAFPNRGSSSVVGRRLGPYKLLRELGHGGMGTVYLAARDDDQYRKEVAVKVVRGLDSDHLRRRFREERQILASLDHPNIARLLDAGATDDGLLYIVMEYVEGTPLDRYCEERRLSVLERLALFRTVCAAVHYAHQHLVVHRDLKPGNILVASDGSPKLLDFGIAKLLSSEGTGGTTLTATGIRLMTPAYASPEQVRGGTIATTSDVYALGVLLFELLTGRHPYRLTTGDPQELARAICEQEPEKPSVVMAATRPGHPLPGDLDTIVLKALQKEPARRYGSAEQFSEDVRRYLAGLPVLARKDTVAYRAAKFLRRHTKGAAAAALIVVTLFGGIVAIVREARIATHERARAERRFGDVRGLANSFMFEFDSAIANLPGATPARELLVKKALEYLDSLAQEAQNDPALLRELATAYQKVGDIQGNPYAANLGNLAGARASYQKALEIRGSLAASAPDDLQVARDLASSYNRVGDVLDVTGDTPGALASYRKAVTVSERFLARAPRDVELRRGIALAYTNIGHILATWSNDTPGSLDSYSKGLAMRKVLLAENPANEDLQQDVISSYVNMGYELSEGGDVPASLESQRSALALSQQMLAANPTSARARRNVSVAYTNVADMLRRRGDLAGAAEGYRKALVLDDALVVADPRDFRARRDLAIDHSRLGEILVEMHDGQSALAEHRAALAIREALSVANPSNAMARSAVADSSFGIAKAHATMAGRRARDGGSQHRHEACHWYQRSLDIWRELQAKGTLPGDDIPQLKQAVAEIARCDAEIATRR